MFAPPVRRTNYLVRRPGADWIEDLEQAFVAATAAGDVGALSEALNKFAFVLFKANRTEDAMELCRAHYRALLRTPELSHYAVQPWINEGRILARCGDFQGACERLLIGVDDEIRIDGTTLRDLDSATIDVCRNVAIVDGFFLALGEGGVAAAERHLRRFEPGDLIEELSLQIALARGDLAAAERHLGQLSGEAAYAPTLACYTAATAGCRDDRPSFAKALLLLVALLDGWARGVDDVASILHALAWLARLHRARVESVIAGAIAGFLIERAAELGDEELRCGFSGQRYVPLPAEAGELASRFLTRARARLQGAAPITPCGQHNGRERKADAGS
ncbi:hypothetical protein [Rhodopseudomonas palustris]|uniref:Uncharacterized protein n=1 Tax=Rhodopseudomonas palustris (strain BisB18) TaxID=316056 RepID=Q212A4_RHOPB